MVSPVRGSRGEARDSRRLTADHSPSTSPATSRGTKPRCRAVLGVDRDRVGVVGVLGLGPQHEPPPRRRGFRLKRLLVKARAGHGDHAQPALGQLRRVAGQEVARLGVDRRVARQPHDASVVGIPVALLVGGADLHRRGNASSKRGSPSSGMSSQAGGVGHVLAALRADARVAVERAQAHQRDLALVVGAEQVRAALAAEHLPEAVLGLPGPELVLAAEDGQRAAGITAVPRRRRRCGPGSGCSGSSRRRSAARRSRTSPLRSHSLL